MAARKPVKGSESIFPTFNVGVPLPADTVAPAATPAAAADRAAKSVSVKPLTPSPELAAVIGSGQLSRGEVVSKVWAYIKKNNLQNPANHREIVADAKLKPVFGGRDKVSMFEMNKHLANYLK